MKKLIYTLMLFFLYLGALEAKTVHAILAIDSDCDLKYQLMIDLRKMQNSVRKISEELDAKTDIIILKDGDLYRSNMLATVRNLKTEEDDIVIFYYSGHGYRTDKKKSMWPYFYFFGNHQTVAFDEIIEILKHKKLHFGLLIADCCNVLLKDYKQIPKKAGKDLPDMDSGFAGCNFKRLFEKSSGLLVISSASPGEFSWSSDRYGAYFTNLLLDNLCIYPSWTNVMQNVKFNLKEYQTPQMEFIPSSRLS